MTARNASTCHIRRSSTSPAVNSQNTLFFDAQRLHQVGELFRSGPLTASTMRSKGPKRMPEELPSYACYDRLNGGGIG
jgi:hypothetical protein